LRRRWWSRVRGRPLGEGIAGRVQAMIDELELRQLELLRANRRLARGQDGTCRSCGRPISPRRLELVQGAVLCAACALIARQSRDLLDPLARRN